jgi:hypothetical protein
MAVLTATSGAPSAGFAGATKVWEVSEGPAAGPSDE